MQSTREKILIFVNRNPGLPATAIAHLLRKNVSSVSARLYELVQQRLIDRKEQISMFPGRGRNDRSWRYYYNV